MNEAPSWDFLVPERNKEKRQNKGVAKSKNIPTSYPTGAFLKELS
jgi:hypothetical protein